MQTVTNVFWRVISTIITGALVVACTSDPPPTTPSPLTPDSDPGPPPAIPTTEGATLTLSASGVTPARVRVYQGTRVTFFNDSAGVHEIQSNPLHLHTDCPELNAVSFIVPGQSRSSDPFRTVRGCGFHDHANEADSRFYGVVFVDPR